MRLFRARRGTAAGEWENGSKHGAADAADRVSADDQVSADAAALAASIIDSLREAFVVLDAHLRVKTANRAFYETFRVAASETEGRLIHELGNGQWDTTQLLRLLRGVSSDHAAVYDFAVEHDFPRIGRRTMLLNARRMRLLAGDADLVLLAMEDVTERDRVDRAVQTSEARYRRLFQTAKDGILILDAHTGRVIDANPFMADLLGYSCEEFLGKELWEIGLFSDKRASQEAYRELRQHGYLRYEHLPLETKAGKAVEVEFVCNTYQVEGREVAQCNIRDVSERSRLERKTQEQAAALADLHRRKDEFLAMLSHELRNPLAPIANAVQLLRLQSNEASLQQKARGIIERQVTQLTRLVDDLMEVSRVTTGRIRLRLEPVLANGIVERAVETARPLIDGHRHELAVELSPQPIWLHADASRLEQIVVNLLTNAAKYTADGGRISLSVEETGGECVLRVRDTGVGIAPALLPRIFDLFTQAERSLDRSQGGLGIGLAVVQRLVELHGGRVAAHSSLGHGSEFVVHLPVVAPDAVAAAAPIAAAAAPSRPGLRLLVVDDNVDMAESLAMLLEAEGHAVRTAHGGPSALAAADEYGPEAVLLDIGLPDLDGFEVAKRIRQNPLHQGMVLIALTGYGQEADRQRSREAGFDHHLVKPVDLGEMHQILAKVKAGASTADPEPARQPGVQSLATAT
ncbi:MAG TPA: ATP-binding protein [Thermoanaerobaculia bacterium]|nr:ATP-binding protein [Thermoanaerobaculia bacterium]